LFSARGFGVARPQEKNGGKRRRWEEGKQRAGKARRHMEPEYTQRPCVEEKPYLISGRNPINRR